MEQKKIDWYLRFAWLLILVSTLLICTYIVVNNIHSCTSQPLEYAVDQIKAKFEVLYVYGRVTITNDKGISDYLDFGDFNFTESESTSETNLNSSFS